MDWSAMAPLKTRTSSVKQFKSAPMMTGMRMFCSSAIKTAHSSEVLLRISALSCPLAQPYRLTTMTGARMPLLIIAIMIRPWLVKLYKASERGTNLAGSSSFLIKRAVPAEGFRASGAQGLAMSMYPL
eukprot:UN3575